MDQADWLDFRNVAELLISSFTERLSEQEDSAPWLDLSKSKLPDAYGHKIQARAVLALQTALLRGELTACIKDGSQYEPIPRAVFLKSTVLRDMLFHGPVLIDPLWPDEWQIWDGKDWYVQRDSLMDWLESDNPLKPEKPEDVPSLSPEEVPEPIIARIPTEAERISLSEAISFIAFEVALPTERLERLLLWTKLYKSHLQDAARKLEDALAKFCDAGSQGKIAFFGSLVNGGSGKKDAPAQISACQLDTVRQYGVGSDSLFPGAGLSDGYSSANYSAQASHGQCDFFADVRIDRAALIEMASDSVQPFSDDERREWIASQPQMSADEAFKIYRQLPRNDGTKQKAFRQEWKEVRQTKIGRPQRSSKKDVRSIFADAFLERNWIATNKRRWRSMPTEIMNTREAAEYLRLGKPTLERFRISGDGPLYLKLGGAVRYRKTDLDAWLDGRISRSTSEAVS